MSDVVKCNKCGHFLIKGNGGYIFFSLGTKIKCFKCGNEYIVGSKQEPPLKISK